MTSWQSNPQDPTDEHDWTQWFAPARDYRDMTWSYTEEAWVPSPIRQ